MPRKQHRERQEDEQQDQPRRPNPFWSGQIAFGLVNVPVSLFPAHRSSRVSLRMTDPEGMPLSRRYFCPREERALTPDQIVRGYEIDKDSFVIVEDDELESIAPEKSREIDLKRFVALDDIDPVYFEHAYFLAPDRKATKAYRLLARTMEDTQRAGIATFVMRGKEHLVAIVAERGILRAETLRFQDELRSPADVGLPVPQRPSDERTREMERAIEGLSADDFERDELAGTRDRLLLQQVERKLASGEDVMPLPDLDESAPDVEDDEDDSGNVIDLMNVLKERLRQTGEDEEADEHKPAPDRGNAGRHSSRKKKARRRAGRDQQERLTKAELYQRARELDIAGRTRMTRDELARAIRKAQ